MNTKQKQFVHEYVLDHNATRAAVRAGYSPARGKQTGYRLMQMPDVAAAIQRLDHEFAERVGITREELLEQFLDYHTRGKRGEVPPQVGLRGLELAAKLTGNMGERSESASSEVRVVTLNFDRDLTAEPEEREWGT